MIYNAIYSRVNQLILKFINDVNDLLKKAIVSDQRTSTHSIEIFFPMFRGCVVYMSALEFYFFREDQFYRFYI